MIMQVFAYTYVYMHLCIVIYTYVYYIIYLFTKQLHEKSKNLGSPKESHRIKPRSFSISFQAAWLRLILGGKRSAR